ncbi:hypothetical protein, partial [Pedobacter antarcticus]|uniref:hypothetical protein n=1 Tax=Pedobacter antarcticus TaxID=34086 RepID=UPI002930806F
LSFSPLSCCYSPGLIYPSFTLAIPFLYPDGISTGIARVKEGYRKGMATPQKSKRESKPD